jgi:hypothetical protein
VSAQDFRQLIMRKLRLARRDHHTDFMSRPVRPDGNELPHRSIAD